MTEIKKESELEKAILKCEAIIQKYMIDTYQGKEDQEYFDTSTKSDITWICSRIYNYCIKTYNSTYCKEKIKPD